jgi:CheY-like chemotaxis protein
MSDIINISKRILVVDDEPDIREVIGECLKMLSFQVDTAASAAEAVNLFMRNSYDLLTLDLKMPGLDGSQLHQILSEEFDNRSVSVDIRRRLPPILIITGCADLPQVQHWLARKSVAGVLLKPIMLECLIDAVEQAMSKSLINAG